MAVYVYRRSNGDELSLQFNDKCLSSAFLTLSTNKERVPVASFLMHMTEGNHPKYVNTFGFAITHAELPKWLKPLVADLEKSAFSVEHVFRIGDQLEVGIISNADRLTLSPVLAAKLLIEPNTKRFIGCRILNTRCRSIIEKHKAATL